MKRLRAYAEFAFGLGFYLLLAGALFDVIANRDVRPFGYPPETWMLMHGYPVTTLWYASLVVGSGVLLLLIPAMFIQFILRGGMRERH